MRHKDSNKMQEILDFSEKFYMSEGRSPSTTEIADAVGFSRGTAYRYLVEMNEIGMISYDGKTIQSNLTMKYSDMKSEVPICGSVPCGSPMEEVENIEHIVSLPTQIFGKGPLYILKATGDSMEDVGIFEGDYVVIKQTSEADIGDIVVALDQDNKNTLKTYGGLSKRTGKPVLKYENFNRYGNKTIEVSQLIIQGVAKHVIKEL